MLILAPPTLHPGALSPLCPYSIRHCEGFGAVHVYLHKFKRSMSVIFIVLATNYPDTSMGVGRNKFQGGLFSLGGSFGTYFNVFRLLQPKLVNVCAETWH